MYIATAKTFLASFLAIVVLSPVVIVLLIETDRLSFRSDIGHVMGMGYFSQLAFFMRQNAYLVMVLVVLLVFASRAESKWILISGWVVLGVLALLSILSSVVIVGKFYVTYASSWSDTVNWLMRMGIQNL
jgi:hypothetical protein